MSAGRPSARQPARHAAPVPMAPLRVGRNRRDHPRQGRDWAGILTTLAQIAADELDVALARIRLRPATTVASPNEGVTAGSLSVQECGLAVRTACAAARGLFLTAAASRFGVPVEALTVEDGVIAGPGNARTSYAELAETVTLSVDVTAPVPAKPASARRIAGTPAARLDMPDKVFGEPRFLHDLRLPGMLHGCVVRSTAVGAKRIAVDEECRRLRARIRHDGARRQLPRRPRRDGGGAVTAAQKLRRATTWTRATPAQRGTARRVAQGRAPRDLRRGDAGRASAGQAPMRIVTLEYSAFLAHASVAPSCAVAGATGASLWTHSQGVYNLRADLGLVLGLDAERIVVEHREGAGCYGHNGADDVALDAALLARAAGGRPVRVQWSREDELTRAPFGAAITVRVAAGLDARGAIVDWRHEIWSNGHVARPGRSDHPRLLAAEELAESFARRPATNPPLATGGGADRNAVPIYDLPAWRITNHRVLSQPIRTSSLRSLGAFANVFTIESFLDEVAVERGEDPLAFRLRHLSDPRARAVLVAACDRAGYSARHRGDGRGQGIGVARYKNSGAYCAVVAAVEIAEEIRLRRHPSSPSTSAR